MLEFTLDIIWYFGYMASHKMTFTLPEELALRFVGRVRARERSRYLAAALTDKLAEHEKRLIRACEIANHDPALREVEKELDALTDEIPAPWEVAQAR
jgi:hypothetical protein